MQIAPKNADCFGAERAGKGGEIWPRWVDAMGEQGRARLGEALTEHAFDSQADTFRRVDAPGELPIRSRQARHAQLNRARSSSVVCIYLRAVSDLRARELVMSREFAWLRPSSSEVQTKLRSVFGLLAGISLSSARASFDWYADALLRVHSDSARDDLGVLRIDAAFTRMALSAMVGGRALRGAHRELCPAIARPGAGDNDALTLRLASQGSWVGEAEPHAPVLIDHGLRNARLCDAHLFVRPDTRAELLSQAARLSQCSPRVQPGRAAPALEGR